MDKTGTRTYLGRAFNGRRKTAFEIRTYLSPWYGTGQPAYGPLFQAALGAIPDRNEGLTIRANLSSTILLTTNPHGRYLGAAVSNGNEIRFVTGVMDAYSFSINAPFSKQPDVGTALNPTVTYKLSTMVPSLTLYDFWDPLTTISRIVTGAAVDVLDVVVNGDRHDFIFSGPAADLLDSKSTLDGSAGLSVFPNEPMLECSTARNVPGHLGQAWLGGGSNQFFTLTEASIRLRNNIVLRNHEFGSSLPRAAVPGQRQVDASFSLFAQDDDQTLALYSAAKAQNTVSAMLQMGQQQGQLMGVYLPMILPELPLFDDSDVRLQWRFNNNTAQGTSDDELFVAFA